MKVALLGATGFVGTAILNETLNRGHKVLANTTDWIPGPCAVLGTDSAP